MANEQPSDSFDFSSKVKRINIELPDYEYFHSPSNVDNIDNRFIGREALIEKFKNILTNSKTKTGAYLVTGYRGMGKSSFVSKVLSLITIPQEPKIKWKWIIICLMFIAASNLIFHNFPNLFIFKKIFNIPLVYIVFIVVLTIITNFKIIFRERIISILLKEYFPGLKERYFKRKKRVVLRLNLGHEILNEKDILSLIAKSIQKGFKNYAYSFRQNTIYYLLKLALLLFLSHTICDKTTLQESFLGDKSFYTVLLPSQKIEILDAKDDSIFCGQINKIFFPKDTLNNNKNDILLTRKLYNCNDSVLLNWNNSDYLTLITRKAIWIVNTVDIYLYSSYLLVSNFINKSVTFADKHIIPTHINYFFIITFFTLLLFLGFTTRLILTSPLIPYTSRRLILRQLNDLNEQIEASIFMESAGSANLSNDYLGLNLSKKKSKQYPIASVRVIEKGLIDVLDEMRRIMSIPQPEFIIVFDELDKIDPGFNTNLNDKEEELPGFESSVSGFVGGTSTRQRKQNVLKLMANMKYFITTAEAKFIFISNRELYDAFLADVSDREFAISSIFHEVFYVDSFLSDSSDQNHYDVTSMTEHYVCNFLFPKNYKLNNEINKLSLKEYNRYLKERIFKSKRRYTSEEIQLLEYKREKVIMLLYQFVHYLTHLSNGAPKKITNFFEKYVRNENDSLIRSDSINVKRNGLLSYFRKPKFYLSFGFQDQNKIGFIHYLANPVMLAIINNVSDYGDKLLVSASFLIDHIFKFHKNGFSWRNLEHTPEILEINRTPELRNFMGSILSFLNQTHISPIVSGLYMFKFPKKISEEISFISRLSEEASAVFNFTLDESLSVKRHYMKLLEYYKKRYNTFAHANIEKGDFIHSIAGIHHILGDLHMLDEEYTEAIFEYQDCIQNISLDFRGNHNDTHSVSQFLFLLRINLKLGLTLEKRKTFNSAYITYSEMVSLLIDFRNFDERDLGLETRVERINDWNKVDPILIKKNVYEYDSSIKFKKEIRPDYISKNEIDNENFIAKGSQMIPSLAPFMTPLKNKVITRLSLFEDVSLIFQPLLAKLFILEKSQLGGISKSNLAVIEEEFLFLHRTINIKEKFLIAADFFRKLGDILYYKNGLIEKESCSFINGLYFWGYDIKKDISDYLESKHDKEITEDLMKGLDESVEIEDDKLKIDVKEILASKYKKNVPIKVFLNSIYFCPPKEITGEICLKISSCNNRRGELFNQDINTPCHACRYYNRSLKILMKYSLNISEDDNPRSKSLIFLSALEKKDSYPYMQSNYAQTLASCLRGLGDILISCSTKKEIINPVFLKAFFQYISKKNSSIEEFERSIDNIQYEKGNKFSNLEKALMYYYAAAKFYRRSSNLKESYSIFKKIIYLFNLYALKGDEEKSFIQGYLDQINKQIVKRALQCLYSSYENIHISEIQKLKKNLNKEMFEDISLDNLSIYPDIEELFYAFYSLKLVSGKIRCKRFIYGFDSQKKEYLSKEYTLNMYSRGKIPENIIETITEGERIIEENKFLSDIVSNNSELLSLLKRKTLSSYRLSNSIYNRLLSVHIKESLNREAVRRLFPSYSFEKNAYKANHPIQFYKHLRTQLTNFDSMTLANALFMKELNIKSTSDYLKKLEFFVIDSIFCLRKFVEVITPFSTTTLFTESFVANIYQRLYEWTQLYDLLFNLYAYNDEKFNKNGKQGIILDKLVNYYNHRLIAEDKEGNKTIDDVKTIIEVQADLKKIFENKTMIFYDALTDKIDKDNTHFLSCNYLIEMAINRYRNAQEMHREGKTYKSMMEEMYFLNDDLDNDSYKFSLALERYQINCGQIKDSIEKLKKIYNNSTLRDIESYSYK